MKRPCVWLTAMLSAGLWGSKVTPAHAADVPATSQPSTIQHGTVQIAIPRVELMPNLPPGYVLMDFDAIARGFDHVVYGPAGRTRVPPLFWWDETHINLPGRAIGIPSYVDHPEMKGGDHHEGITVLGSLVGATITGIDKRTGDDDYVAMASAYFNSKNGLNVVLNHSSTTTGQTYWYELFPQILFDLLAHRYPSETKLAEQSNQAAAQWLRAYDALAKDGKPSFEQTAFDLATMKPVDNGRWHEPDAAAGFAQIFFATYERTHDDRYLAAAKGCVQALEDRAGNPSYEILMPFGAYAAARLNAEHGTAYDVGRLVDEFFQPNSDVRPNWGLIVGNWNGHEMSGLLGSTTDAGGYGFVMNTYASGIGLIPIARYDERYARAIAKWVLNASGAVRYAYPGQLPVENTSAPAFASDPPNVIAFEGVRHRLKGKSPFAGGDPTVYGWGPCDLGLYGSGFSGVFGGSIRPTSDPAILQLDLLAPDPCAPKAFPTHMYLNPHDDARTIRVDVGPTPVDLYDSIENRVIATNQHGPSEISVPPGGVREIVRVPAGSAITHDARIARVGDVVIDYDDGSQPRAAPATRPSKPSLARRIAVPHATLSIDGKPDDWTRHGSRPITIDTGGRGTMKMNLSFAWDDDYLYVLARETSKATESHEPPDAAQLGATPWDWDSVGLAIDLGNGRRATISSFMVLFGLNSDGARDVAFSAQAPDDGSARLSAATAGSRTAGDRLVEGRIAWKGVESASFGTGEPVKITPGLTIGCEPLLVEQNHKRQSWIGGAQYTQPTGNDANSIDLVLVP